MGIVTAIHQNEWQDRVFSVLSMAGGAFPSYWMAIMILLLFCRYLRLLPVMGYEGFISLIMPVLALSLGGISDVARTTRSSMLETLDKEFVLALRAKGLRKHPVIYKHVLKKRPCSGGNGTERAVGQADRRRFGGGACIFTSRDGFHDRQCRGNKRPGCGAWLCRLPVAYDRRDQYYCRCYQCFFKSTYQSTV